MSEFALPTDLSNCSLVAPKPNFYYQFLKAEVQKKFAADQSIDAESMDKIIEIVKYLSPCESKRCREYDFEVKNSKPNGWTFVKAFSSTRPQTNVPIIKNIS